MIKKLDGQQLFCTSSEVRLKPLGETWYSKIHTTLDFYVSQIH